MKKSTLITTLVSICLISAIGFTSSTFAMHVGVPVHTKKVFGPSIKNPHKLVKFMHKIIKMDISSFLKEDMTDEEKNELQNAVKKNMEESKEIREEIRRANIDGEDISDLVDKYVEHQIAGLDLFDKYIDETKANEWEKVKADYEEDIRNNSEFRMDIKENRDQIRGNRKSIKENWKKFFDENGKIRDFLKSDLTEEENNELKEIRRTHFKKLQEIRKEIIEAYKNWEDIEKLEDQFAEEEKSALDVLDDYIDEDKTDEWEEYKKNYASCIDKNDEYRNQIIESRVKIGEKLSERKKEGLENLVERIDRILSNVDEDKLEVVVENLSKKIEKIRERVENSNMSDDKKEEMNYILDEIDTLLKKYA